MAGAKIRKTHCSIGLLFLWREGPELFSDAQAPSAAALGGKGRFYLGVSLLRSVKDVRCDEGSVYALRGSARGP